MPPHIHSLATAVPPHALTQEDAARFSRALFEEKYSHFDRLSATFRTAGVDCRYSVIPPQWFFRPHGWADRNHAYLEGALALFQDAAGQALSTAGWRADEVDVIVTVSSTGIATPTLEAQSMETMGFRDDVRRVPVFGLGCAGGVSGLSIAADQAAAAPGARVLLVVVEVCTTAFRADRLQKADIIAAVLFSDGAAAACLCTAPPATGPAIACGRPVQKTWPNTLAIMGWDVDDEGLGVVFDRSIPDFVLSEFAQAADTALAATGLARDSVDRLVCHPGGAKVIEAIESTLSLGQGTLDSEREILRQYGNMSAPTVLFVLKDVLDRGISGQLVACALGPGFTAAFLPLSVTRAAAVAPIGIAAE